MMLKICRSCHDLPHPSPILYLSCPYGHAFHSAYYLHVVLILSNVIHINHLIMHFTAMLHTMGLGVSHYVCVYVYVYVYVYAYVYVYVYLYVYVFCMRMCMCSYMVAVN